MPTFVQLKALCRDKGIKGYSNKNKAELIALCGGNVANVSKQTVAQLKQNCRDKKIKGYSNKNKAQLIPLCGGPLSSSQHQVQPAVNVANVSKQTVAQLKQNCRDKKIKGYSGKKKALLIPLCGGPLNQSQQQVQPVPLPVPVPVYVPPPYVYLWGVQQPVVIQQPYVPPIKSQSEKDFIAVSDKYIKSLTFTQQKIIRVSTYKSEHHINEELLTLLKNPKKTLDVYTRTYISQLYDIWKNAPKFEKDTTLYRGIRGNNIPAFSNAKKGDILFNPILLATSFEMLHPYNTYSNVFDKQCCVLWIKFKKGQRALFIDSIAVANNLQQVLFMPGMEFRVTDVKKTEYLGKSRLTLVLECVKCDIDNFYDRYPQIKRVKGDVLTGQYNKYQQYYNRFPLWKKYI